MTDTYIIDVSDEKLDEYDQLQQKDAEERTDEEDERLDELEEETDVSSTRDVLRAFATWAGNAKYPVHINTGQPERYQAYFGTGVWLDDMPVGEWSDEDYGRIELKIPAKGDTAVLYANFRGYGDASDAEGENPRGIKRDIDRLDIGTDLVGYADGSEVFRVQPNLNMRLDVGAVTTDTA